MVRARLKTSLRCATRRVFVLYPFERYAKACNCVSSRFTTTYFSALLVHPLTPHPSPLSPLLRQFIEHVSKSVNFTPFDTRWVPCSAKFVLLGIHPRGTGALKIYEMDQGDLKMVAEV
jgi:hypothetical protein